ncbi:hypothetical protein VUR80DRAFT_675 [Thermomyces stellatus]
MRSQCQRVPSLQIYQGTHPSYVICRKTLTKLSPGRVCWLVRAFPQKLLHSSHPRRAFRVHHPAAAAGRSSWFPVRRSPYVDSAFFPSPSNAKILAPAETLPREPAHRGRTLSRPRLRQPTAATVLRGPTASFPPPA